MKKQSNNIQTMSQIIEGLKAQPSKIKNEYKRRYNEELNNIIINMLDYVDMEVLEVEQSANGFNRGTLCENIFKYHVFMYLGKEFNGLKSVTKSCDIDLRRADKMILKELGLKASTYEIKTLTKIANAHASAHSNKNYIIIDLKRNNCIMLVDSDSLVYDNSGHVTGYIKGQRLDLLTELLGL